MPRAEDLQIRGNKVAVALKSVEDQVLQLSRVVEHGLAKGQALSSRTSVLRERGQRLQLDCEQSIRNVAALEKRVGEMASQLDSSTLRSEQTQNMLKEMESGFGNVIDAIDLQLNRLKIEIEEVKKSEMRFQTQEARMRALVQAAEEKASAQRSRAEAAWAEAATARAAADKAAIEWLASLNASKSEAEDLREEVREHRQRALQLHESVRHHKEKVDKERDKVNAERRAFEELKGKSESEIRQLQIQGVKTGEQILQLQNELADMRRIHDSVVSIAAQQTETIRNFEAKVAEVSAARDASIAKAEGMQVSSVRAHQGSDLNLSLTIWLLQELEAEVKRLKELLRVADEDKQALDLCANKAANEIERLRKVNTNLEHRVLELTAQVSVWLICFIEKYAKQSKVLQRRHQHVRISSITNKKNRPRLGMCERLSCSLLPPVSVHRERAASM